MYLCSVSLNDVQITLRDENDREIQICAILSIDCAQIPGCTSRRQDQTVATVRFRARDNAIDFI